jgi:hypothetical protein
MAGDEREPHPDLAELFLPADSTYALAIGEALNDYAPAWVRAVMPGEAFSTVPYVRPGGEILLRLSRWPKVGRVLQTIDAVEQLGVDPVDACPDHWQQLQNRLASCEPPRPYATDRHRAWLLRRRIGA